MPVSPPEQAVPASEHTLVARAVQGDEAAFECLMRRHNQLLFRTARSVTRDDTEAEDVVQEAYLRAWRALPTYQAHSRLATWLVRITLNEALVRRRRKGAQIIPLEAAMESPESDLQQALTEAPDSGPEQAAVRAQVRRLMEARIGLLPEVFRTVFVLRAIEEMSVEDVAQALGIPEATVRSRFFRARALLREGIAQVLDIAQGDAFTFDGSRCDRIVSQVLARARIRGLTRTP